MACKRSKDEPSECNSFLQSSKRMGQVATNFLSVSASMDQVDDLPVTQIVFPSEMRSMRSILDTNHGNKENINIDYLPANLVEEFDSLENKIINSNDKDIICRKLKQIDGRNVSDFLKNALKTCLTDKLCCSINRTGADKKRRFIGPVESLIFDAAYCLFPTATASSMTTIIAKHLKKSKDCYFAARKRSSSLTSDIQILSPVRKKRNLNTDSCSDSS
nr:uncharacterized protein LOC105845854 isoform X3 [Hydra vulgaris]